MTALPPDLKQVLVKIDQEAPKSSEKAYRQYVSACIITHPELSRLTAPEIDKRDPQKASINGYIGARIRTHFRQVAAPNPQNGNGHKTKLERFAEKYCCRVGRSFVVSDAAADLEVTDAAITRYMHLLSSIQGYQFKKLAAGVYKVETLPAPKPPEPERVIPPSAPMVQPPLPMAVDSAAVAVAQRVINSADFQAMLALTVKSAVVEQLKNCQIVSTLQSL